MGQRRRRARRRTWWGKPAGPGRVWISARELVELQRGALRVSELERDLNAASAESMAIRLQRERMGDMSPLPDERQEALFQDLPLTADGRLHEAAFTALLDKTIRRDRLRPVRPIPRGGEAG